MGAGISPVQFQTLKQFEAQLESSASASQVLARWCACRHLADPPVVQVVRVLSVGKAADAGVLRHLDAAPNEPVRYRRVKLICGEHVLSEADNWYRPAALTPEMNRRLDTTDTPFGIVVAPLGFRRRTLSVKWLVEPAAARPGPAAGKSPARHDVLRHVGVLSTAQGTPFSVVVETYTAEILASPAEGPHSINP